MLKSFASSCARQATRSSSVRQAVSAICQRHFSSGLRTPLYDWHTDQGGKMVDFAGYDLPVMYKAGIRQEHLHCRDSAAIFDVSHMGQLVFRSPDGDASAVESAIDFLETACVSDVSALKVNQGTLSLLTTTEGGIMDDMIINRHADYLYVVVNAGCKDKDTAHMRKLHAEWEAANPSRPKFEISSLDDQSALIALQGPKAQTALQSYVTGVDLSQLGFMTGTQTSLSGITDETCFVTRCGYTGEDGFEISLPASVASDFADSLLASGDGSVVKPAGLGARDSLRLEAGLCLYGHDMNEDITPIEATLAWVLSKTRTNYNGHDAISAMRKAGPAKKRVGFVVEGKSAPPREGCPVLTEEGEEVGVVTSGSFSPTLNKPIGMAYVPKALAKSGTPLQVQVRNKKSPITVSKMPFVPAKYYKGP